MGVFPDAMCFQTLYKYENLNKNTSTVNQLLFVTTLFCDLHVPEMNVLQQLIFETKPYSHWFF